MPTFSDIDEWCSDAHSIAQTFERPFGIALFVAEPVSVSLELPHLDAQLGALFVAQLSSLEETAFARIQIPVNGVYCVAGIA
ncbi:MAG TPA: hypothetical protein VK855_11935 [Thioalkalivibrio sp.]|nr:hypothetical protein [Thioalkalivibrio sp.]